MKQRLTRMGAALAVLLGLMMAVNAEPAAAQLAPRDQETPDILFLDEPREQYLLVWSEDRGAGGRIYAKRVFANGLPVGGALGGEWELTRSTGPIGQKGDQRWPAVTDGLVVWSEKADGATDYDLYAQRLFSNFRAYGKPRMIAGGPGDQAYPDVTRASNGDYLVVWSEDTNDAGDVMARRVTSAITMRGAPFALASGPGTAEDPVITRDLSDPSYFLILWTDDRAGNRDIYSTKITESGLPRGGPTGGHIPVVESPQDDYAPHVLFSFDFGRSQRLTPDTRSLLLWTTDDVADGPDVMGQRLRENGFPSGNPFVVAGGPGEQSWPAAARREEDTRQRRGNKDRWLAVWSSDANGTLDLMSVEVQLNGIPRGPVRPLVAD